jgi:hypothetical protein
MQYSLVLPFSQSLIKFEIHSLRRETSNVRLCAFLDHLKRFQAGRQLASEFAFPGEKHHMDSGRAERQGSG